MCVSQSKCHLLFFNSAVGRQDFHAHRLVLASCSKFLRAVLEDQPSEAVLLIPDVEPATFKQLLSYIYTGFVEINGNSGLDRFLAACQLLDVAEPLITQNVDQQMNIEVLEEEMLDEEFIVSETPQSSNMVREILSAEMAVRRNAPPKRSPKLQSPTAKKARLNTFRAQNGQMMGKLMTQLEDLVAGIYRSHNIDGHYSVRVEVKNDALNGWWRCCLCQKSLEVSSEQVRGPNDEFIFQKWLPNNVEQHIASEHLK